MTDSDAADRRPARLADRIVALGASAGGLEALDRFFTDIDPDLPAAFIVIQHLAPSHKTMMDTLLGRHTRMPVKVAAEGDTVMAGQVYVIPAGVTMTLVDSRLHLAPRPTQGVNHPIDEFFHSLAHSGCEQMIGLVLSGTGSDGSEGLQSLAEAGGWILVQNPASASFDGMPLNALATGLAHQSDTPEKLAHFVSEIIRERRAPPLLKTISADEPSIEKTLERVAVQLGLELSSYKPHTLLRRLERRVLATARHDIESYLTLLEESPEEAANLRREMMIPVTAFFRDREAFEALVQKVMRPLLLQRAQDSQPRLRMWSVGCSTGQEPYSLAILALEAMRELGIEAELKIFASDVEQSYLSVASAGRYPARLLQQMPVELRNRYFTPVEDGGFQVTPRLRRAIVFSRHDVLNDPPFLHLDLVVCRNMIIYLRPAPQERAIRRMLFGLVSGGALFLGGSETPGKLASLMDTVCARNKIYRMRGQLRHLASEDVLLVPGRHTGVRERRLEAPAPLSDATTSVGPAAGCLIGAYVPPSVVIDGNREIRHVFGDVYPYLKFRAGDASLDLVQLLPERTAAVVSTLIFSALRDGKEPKSVILHPADDDEMAADRPLRILLRPVPANGQNGPTQLIVSFETLPAAEGIPPLPVGADDIATLSAHRTAELETELARVRDTLRKTIEELGSANEELQASNEELMASNEELQSTNEELQSVNEELHTVNAELQEKIVQLNEAYADLEGLSRAARIPLVFLDAHGRITRFSSQATEIFRLREQDAGRPLTDINHSLDMPELEDRIAEAMDTQQTIQQEVSGRDGRTWLVTLQPFATRSREESRMVMSFIDISTIQAMRYLQSVIDAAPQNMAVLDAEGNIRMVNAAWQSFANANGGTKALANGQKLNYLDTLREAARSDGEAAQALAGLEEMLDGKRANFSFIYPCHSATERRWFMMHASPLREGGCVVTHLNITNMALPKGEESEA